MATDSSIVSWAATSRRPPRTFSSDACTARQPSAGAGSPAARWSHQRAHRRHLHNTPTNSRTATCRRTPVPTAHRSTTTDSPLVDSILDRTQRGYPQLGSRRARRRASPAIVRTTPPRCATQTRRPPPSSAPGGRSLGHRAALSAPGPTRSASQSTSGATSRQSAATFVDGCRRADPVRPVEVAADRQLAEAQQVDARCVRRHTGRGPGQLAATVDPPAAGAQPGDEAVQRGTGRRDDRLAVAQQLRALRRQPAAT